MDTSWGGASDDMGGVQEWRQVRRGERLQWPHPPCRANRLREVALLSRRQRDDVAGRQAEIRSVRTRISRVDGDARSRRIEALQPLYGVLFQRNDQGRRKDCASRVVASVLDQGREGCRGALFARPCGRRDAGAGVGNARRARRVPALSLRQLHERRERRRERDASLHQPQERDGAD